MFRKSRREWLVSLLLVPIVALVACAPQEAPAPSATAAPGVTPVVQPTAVATHPMTAADAEWQKVLASARKEGSLNFYTTFAPPELRIAMTKTIQDNYGIKMEWLVAGGGAINAERIRVEQKSKQYVADVLWMGFSVLLTQELRAVNAIKPFTPPVLGLEPGVWLGKGVDGITDQRDALAVTQKFSIIPVVNTKLVRSEDIPKSYKELLDPKWKGKLVMMDPTVPGGGSYTFSLLKKEYGLELWEKMREQNISIIRDYSEVGRQVSVGEAYVGLGLAFSHIMPYLVAGAPIKIIAPVEGSIKTNTPMYLINNAPHSNAGKVFINWALTREGQDMISRGTGEQPIRRDVEYKTHPEIEKTVRDMPKFLVGDWKVMEEFDADVSAGTARKVLGLK